MSKSSPSPSLEELRKQILTLENKLASHIETGHPDPDQTKPCGYPGDVADEIVELIAEHHKALEDFERGDYNRLKQLESEGIKRYQEMRKAEKLTPEAVVSFINQLSPWNLETTGLSVFAGYHNRLLDSLIEESDYFASQPNGDAESVRAVTIKVLESKRLE